MKRWIFNIASGLSLLLCLAAVLLWVRSYWFWDCAWVGSERYVTRAAKLEPAASATGTIPSSMVRLIRCPRMWVIASACGGVMATISNAEHEAKDDGQAATAINAGRVYSKPTWSSEKAFGYPTLHQPTFGPLWGFCLTNRQLAQPPNPNDVAFIRGLIVPHWFVCVLLSLLPVWRAYTLVAWHRHQRRGRLGLCLHCGYDIRATPARCPECGTPIANAPKATAN